MKDENRLNYVEEKKPSMVKRFFVVLLVTVVLLGAAGYAGMYILFRGPFVHAAAAFVQDVGDAPVGKAALTLFLTAEEQEALMSIDSGTGIAAGDQKLYSVYPKLG